ncbi:chemotaxis protein CheW [Phosphitispora sp. TUW77]|uniref:chemotaxis protein CheW n=1 Tax=Phosphitispora sp. TUW77 TaxID=3152361 RepID=UPI003AB224E3
MSLNLDASPEELKIFLEEAEEHFQTLEEELIRMEKEEFNEDLMQEIFRASHTLKGSSATIGHNRMAQLTHAMENVLDKLRKRQIEVSSHLIDILFECLDCLRVLRDEIINNEQSDLDLKDILYKLALVVETDIAPVEKEAAPLVASEVSPVQEGGACQKMFDGKLELSWEEKDAIQHGVEEGAFPYFIRLKFNMEPEMAAVRIFVTMMAFGEMGDVIKSIPTAEEIEKEKVSNCLDMIVTSKVEAEYIKKLIKELPDIEEFDLSIINTSQFLSGQRNNNEETARTDVNKSALKEEKNDKAGDGIKKLNSVKTNRTVRVDVELLDGLMNLVGELVIDRTRLFQILNQMESEYEMDEMSQDLGRTSVHIARVTTQLQEHIMKARMLPVENLFNKFPRMVRDLSQKAGKEVNFIMTGQETELDRSIIEEIGDPLIHLLRNAVDHGLELPEERESMGKNRVGHLKLQASHEENHIIITIKDDGKGINPEAVKQSGIKKGLISEEQARRLTDKEAINLIFLSGLSTVKKVTDVSGRGVGMDVVRNNIEKINGAIEINSIVEKGTEIKIKLPLTLAIIRALLVSIGEAVYAIPLSTVTETIRINKQQIEYVNNHEVIVVRGKALPLIRLKTVFSGCIEEGEKEKLFIVVVNLAGQQVGLVVDSLVGEQEIVIKSLGKYVGDVQGISGATILGDGNVALIVDVSNLIKKVAS